MSARGKIITFSLLLFIILALGWMSYSPPERFRIGSNYTAKIVCTNVFIAGRNENDILKIDVQAPGNPFLKLMQVRVDREHGLVHANLFGFIGNGLAVYRPGTGCAAVPDGDIQTASKFHYSAPAIPTPSAKVSWPVGSKAELNDNVNNVISQDSLAGPGIRGVAVIHNGKLIAQRYTSGFDERTPLLGWSMTKTVNAALVGIQVGAGKLALDQRGFWPTKTPSDGREKIALADLLAMSSGLQFNENYGDVSDVTRMLYLEPDMASFPYKQPLEHQPNTFWNYSTGTSVLLARLWQNSVGNEAEALTFPRDRLFLPLGMSSAIIEADARGTIAGGSYMYATAQDWARFGQFLLQDGVWNGVPILPEGYVKMMHTLAPTSEGEYGQGQLWVRGPAGKNSTGANPDIPFHLPADTYWLEGHDGQYVAVVPSLQLVMVRLGITPGDLHYQPQAMLAEVIKALQ